MRRELFSLDGQGEEMHEVYDMPEKPGGFWPSVTKVPCPVAGCDQTVVWYEAGYVPGYRVCMRTLDARSGRYDHESIRHRFLAIGGRAPMLVRENDPGHTKTPEG